MNHSAILIIDFGSQVTQLIARRIREAGVYCEVHPFNKISANGLPFTPQGVILSGSPASVNDENAPHLPDCVIKANIPIFGICYGQQLLCHSLGGRVEGSLEREFGRAEITIKKHAPIFKDLWHQDQSYPVWMSHGDRVTKIPEDFEVIASSKHAPYAMIYSESRNIYAVQFHPEVVHTPDGAQLLKNFATQICGCAGDWTMASFKEEQIQKIREKVGDRHVVCGLSGGVDSSVAALLIHEAIGDQLTCVFVDTGLLRHNEAEQVVSTFKDHYHIPLVHRQESMRFLGALEGVSDPEQKRKIIGSLFIDVFEEACQDIGEVDFLAQGTLYPDVIESVAFDGQPSVTIKSHHNVGGLPERMRLKLLEPLRDLFKDEVRNLGRELGLPSTFVDRHPFPGPGLAIRIPGDITAEKVKLLQAADRIFLEEVRENDLYDDIWQAFTVLLPVKTVGVMGDSRTYDHVCALRAVTSIDGMTADFFPFDMNILGRIATRIINEVNGINRVVYDVTSKPPGTIEWE